MGIARQATLQEAPVNGTSRLTVVTPQGDQGALPANEEMAALLRAVATQGDRQAFAVLFKHFAPRVAAYLRRGGTPAASAEDLAQEAMAILWRKSAGYDPARGSVATWIFTIARNLRIDRHRRDGTSGWSFIDGEDAERPDHPDPAASPEERLAARQREARVRGALRQLSREQARVLQLSYFTESPHSEIARELGIPLGTVKSRIRRALITLRRLIDATPP
jgi:RNA polymerase sigma factor (sigma-70 family)